MPDDGPVAMSPPRIIDCRQCGGDGVIHGSLQDYFEGGGHTCPTCLGSTTEEVEDEPVSEEDLPLIWPT